MLLFDTLKGKMNCVKANVNVGYRMVASPVETKSAVYGDKISKSLDNTKEKLNEKKEQLKEKKQQKIIDIAKKIIEKNINDEIGEKETEKIVEQAVKETPEVEVFDLERKEEITENAKLNELTEVMKNAVNEVFNESNPETTIPNDVDTDKIVEAIYNVSEEVEEKSMNQDKKEVESVETETKVIPNIKSDFINIASSIELLREKYNLSNNQIKRLFKHNTLEFDGEEYNNILGLENNNVVVVGAKSKNSNRVVYHVYLFNAEGLVKEFNSKKAYNEYLKGGNN